jgi:hypothetical protein
LYNRRLPAIATDSGTRYRSNVIEEHKRSECHIASSNAVKILRLSSSERQVTVPIMRQFAATNLALANRVGAMMIHVYLGTKRLTLSARSFPSRVVAGHIASSFDFTTYAPVEAKDINFQYLTPAEHLYFLECIVVCHRKELQRRVASALAFSLRCDGSVDRTQMDKIYVTAKVVEHDGTEDNLFLGCAEPSERGAAGVFDAVKSACTATLGTSDSWDTVRRSVSSFVTDGASVNTGCRNGLWVLLDNDVTEATGHGIPLKIWCAAHRSSLAWKSVTSTVSEARILISDLVSISTYFHSSAIRTRELKKLAEDRSLSLLRLPRFFDVRWAEFTGDLLEAILTSWYPLVLYFQTAADNGDREAQGFLNFLTSRSTLQLTSFLADVTSVFARFQKNLQSDNITVLDLPHQVDSAKQQIAALRTSSLPGGWVSALNKEMVTSPDECTLKGVSLSMKERRTKNAHQYVLSKRDHEAVNNEVVEGLLNFLSERFDTDLDTANLQKLVRFDPTVDLEAVGDILPEVDVAELSIEFREVQNLGMANSLRETPIRESLKRLLHAKVYPNLVTCFAQMLAAKPHSADVERLISTSNILKSSDRSSMEIETENLYLYVHHNMPPLAKWDPRDAVNKWLCDKDRRKRSCPQATDQAWYNGIFERAHTAKADRLDVQEKKKTRKF